MVDSGGSATSDAGAISANVCLVTPTTVALDARWTAHRVTLAHDRIRGDEPYEELITLRCDVASRQCSGARLDVDAVVASGPKVEHLTTIESARLTYRTTSAIIQWEHARLTLDPELGEATLEILAEDPAAARNGERPEFIRSGVRASAKCGAPSWWLRARDAGTK